MPLTNILNQQPTIDWSNPANYRSPDTHSSLTQTPSSINPVSSTGQFVFPTNKFLDLSGGLPGGLLQPPIYRSGLTGEQVSYNNGMTWNNVSTTSSLSNIKWNTPIDSMPRGTTFSSPQFSQNSFQAADVLASGNLVAAATQAALQPTNKLAQAQFAAVSNQQKDLGYFG